MTICTRRKITLDKVLYPLLPIEILKFNKFIHPRSTRTQDCVENACMFSVGCFKSSETPLALKHVETNDSGMTGNIWKLYLVQRLKSHKVPSNLLLHEAPLSKS